MIRRLDNSTNPDDRNLSRKKRRISENCNQDIDRNTYTNNCKYWKLEKSYRENGYWNIFKLCLSIKQDRIGVVLSRKTNNKFKIMIIETNIGKHKEMWSEEGIISSPNQIAFNDKLDICIVAYQSNDIDLFKITNSQSISKQNIAINNGKNSDPNIALIGILINKIILIRKRGILFPRCITEYDIKTGKQSEYELTNNTVNVIYGGNENGSKYIILPPPKKANKNKIIIHDNDNSTRYDIQHNLEILKNTDFESLIADKYLKRIILKSNDKIYCLQIGKKTEVENINLQQHNDGSTSFDVNGVNDSPKKIICHSDFVFKEIISSHFKIDNFYNSDIFIGHNQNQLIIWRICNVEQTKKVLLRSTSIFDELICGMISEYLFQIPQKFIIRFIDYNKKQFAIEGLDGKHGFIILHNNAHAESFVFKLEYSLILNLANQSQCSHIFTISLPKK